MASSPRTVLVIAVPVMGDVLLSTPLVRSIKLAWPDAEIDVLARPGGAAVLEGNPDIRTCIELHKKPPTRELLRFLFSRFREYDLVLSNSASDRAFIYSLVMGKERVSLVYQLHSNMALKQRFYRYSQIIDYERYNTVVQNLKLVDHLGVEKRYEIVLPRNPGSDAAIASALGEDWRERPLAIVHPNSAAPYKRWHAEGWHSVVRHLADRGLRVLVTGSASEIDIDYIENELELTDGPAESLAGKLSLADVARLLEQARVYVGVDTLVSHMAAAANTPTVAIFGPVNPVTWGPWPEGFEGGDSPWRKVGAQSIGNVTIVQGRKHCVPCDKSGCDNRLDSYSECLDTLDAATVIAAVDERLR